MRTVASLYNTDFHAWAVKQTNFIKKHQIDKLDLAHLQEELEIMGATERRELSNRLAVLLMHLLKWKYQPPRRSVSWELTIKEQRIEVTKHLDSNPSLKAKVNEYIDDVYELATIRAARETKLSEKSFPVKCEWSIKQVLDKNFFPS